MSVDICAKCGEDHLGPCTPRFEDDLIAQANAILKPEAQFRRLAAPGECVECDRYRAEGLSMFPSHVASARCESGKRAHCTCDACF